MSSGEYAAADVRSVPVVVPARAIGGRSISGAFSLRAIAAGMVHYYLLQRPRMYRRWNVRGPTGCGPASWYGQDSWTTAVCTVARVGAASGAVVVGAGRAQTGYR